MNRDISSRDKYEGDAYLKDIEDTHFFDVDGGIYKPKSCRTETRSEKDNRGASPSTPFFVNPSSDGCLIGIATFSALVAFATLLVVGAYTYVAHGQWEEMRKAANFASRSANAAEVSNTTTRTALEVGERAYVGDKGIKISGKVAPSDQPTVVVDILNGGRTPALNLVSAVSMTYSLKPMKKFERADTTGASRSTLLPGADTWSNGVTTKRLLLTEEAQALDNKTAWLYVYGVIEYDDVFGKHWESTFCYFYVPKSPSVFSNCPYGNSIR